MNGDREKSRLTVTQLTAVEYLIIELCTTCMDKFFDLLNMSAFTSLRAGKSISNQTET